MVLVCEAHAGQEIIFSNAQDGQPYPEIHEYNKKFEGKELTYKLHNLSPDIKKASHQQRAIAGAFNMWSMVIKDLKFRRIYDQSNEDPDLDIWYRPKEDFSSENVLAHATYPGQTRFYIEINDEWDWVSHTAIADIGHPPLVPVIGHEIGHCLGLVHDTHDPVSLMYPSFNLGQKKNDLGPRDISRIQWLYGVRTISQRMWDILMRRRDRGYDFD